LKDFKEVHHNLLQIKGYLDGANKMTVHRAVYERVNKYTAEH